MSPEREGYAPEEAMNWHPPEEPDVQREPAEPVQENPEGAERTQGEESEAAPETLETAAKAPGESSEGSSESPSAEEEVAEVPTEGSNETEDDAKRGEKSPEQESDEEDEKEREKLEQEARFGLIKLHELLQLDPNMRQGKPPKREHLDTLIDASGILATILPGARRLIDEALHHDKAFRTAELPEFVKRGMAVIAEWLIAEDMKRSMDRHFARRERGGGAAT